MSGLPPISKIHRLIYRHPKLCLLSPQSIFQPAGLPSPRLVPIRLKSSSIFNKWTGSSDNDHSIHRAQRRDETDPEVKGTAEGIRERAQSWGIRDRTKSQAVTEREGSTFAKKAKKEHPEAPEPLVGVNDERGRKGE
ncbi:hypothetical protein MPDQ_006321 [Monascus purpureus]|uniref:Uncharacterized protein n=1 Tax=Monascus purpureus TaxID=5098 RepID=A0A507QWY5_MONPU|nr:hypothetical protein MPDQ_006321 [Monascus purpureus]BDD64307.1 hypothetical protein MAP00_009138 [Monascus purpureus]